MGVFIRLVGFGLAWVVTYHRTLSITRNNQIEKRGPIGNAAFPTAGASVLGLVPITDFAINCDWMPSVPAFLGLHVGPRICNLFRR